jgi:hypothetical protein
MEQSNSSEELLLKVESLQTLMIAYATGGHVEEEEYKQLRSELINNPQTQHLLPKFVKTCRDLRQFWDFIQPTYPTYQSRRIFLREKFEPLMNKLDNSQMTPADSDISSALGSYDANYIHEIWNKALERRDTDPDAAITSARTLLEGVCKHILDDCGINYSGIESLPKLYRLTATQLNLSPDQHTEDIFKQILGGCQSVVEGLGAVRNRLSDAHGQGRKQIKPAARHGELAVNLAGSMALFLVRTWEFKKSQS